MTIPELIGRGQKGQPIYLYSSVSPNSGINTVIIGDQSVLVSTVSIDLGNYFTAEQVLESYTLRAGLLSGQVLATYGLVSLSLTPVV